MPAIPATTSGRRVAAPLPPPRLSGLQSPGLALLLGPSPDVAAATTAAAVMAQLPSALTHLPGPLLQLVLLGLLTQ